MKLTKLRSDRSPKLMIIPMIDIIFFLLVFFMMSTLYMTEQHIIPVALPQAATAQTTAAQWVSVTLTAQGRVMLGQEEVSADKLPGRIREELRQHPEAGFVLRADRQVEYGRVVSLLDELQRSGVRRLAVAAERKP